MSISSGSVDDHHNNDYSSQPRGFLTPPPSWRTRRCSPPVMPASEKKPRKADLFHVIHKVPSGDSPYVRAKHAQLIDKDPSRAISLFWAAINSGDRVDSALKDMAVVMKQLDRSDEAIEAIKSFRHLCPPESQESIDNILVELYKQSGRIEEEIEMLRIKLKQVEEGIAFGGKRTKMARSQGKKVQITVEKEYSRLLGNLAWAYMQQKNFKSAEENYRKALSLESDKNKQCNLAICLMHMNKLTEAKFLLQAIRDSSNHMDESHVKSYERACQMLVEFESQRGHKPMKQSPPLPLYVNKMHNGAFTEFPFEKRAEFNCKKGQEAYCQFKMARKSPSCDGVIPKVPFTQPRRCSRSGGQTKGGFIDNGYGFSCRKLSFGSSTSSENVQPLVNQNSDYYSISTAPPNEMPRVMPQFSEKHFPVIGGGRRKISSDNFDANGGILKPLETNEENSDRNNSGQCCKLISAISIGTSDTKDGQNLNLQTSWRKTCELSTCEHKKSWADMVEEDEKEGFDDENVDYNIIHETPKLLNQAEKLSQKIELIDLGSGYFTQPDKTTLQTNQSARRSLCFDQNHEQDIAKCHCTSPLTKKILDFGGGGVEDFSFVKSMKRGNRLQVFKDITP